MGIKVLARVECDKHGCKHLVYRTYGGRTGRKPSNDTNEIVRLRNEGWSVITGGYPSTFDDVRVVLCPEHAVEEPRKDARA